MQPATRWRPRRAIGSGQEIAAHRWPVHLPAHCRAEWDVVIGAHHNLLLLGTPPATDEILVAMKPHLHKPIQKYRPKIGLALPRPLKGTLVLLDVDRLDLKQQRQLLRWLDHFHQRLHVQVVSTTSEPIFSLVETDVFLADLYYKLNIVRIDLSETNL